MAIFFKILNDNQEVIQLISYDNLSPNISQSNIIQITEEEYNQYSLEFEEKALFTDKLYRNEIQISDIPLNWQDEIQTKVDSIISEIGLFENQKIPAEELESMIEEIL